MSDKNLERGLKSRHLMMIALGGSIGTGLFVASGGAIHEAGPGGAMLGYALISVMVFFLMTSLGEMSAYSPTTGTFNEYSSKYVDPAFGFAMGWNYWFNWAITVAVEVLAAAFIMQFWFPDTNTLLWSSGFFLLIFILNILTVKVFGETEYWLSMIKVTFVIIFIIVGGLTIFGMIGHKAPVGFSNWTIGDAPFHGGFLSFMGVFLIAGFSFQGTELIGVAAGEAKNPGKAIPKAIKNTFWRIVIFYILAIGVISFLIPYNDANLVNPNSDVTLSPFTIIFKQAGLTFAATIMNAVILTAVLSACNASMYSATRTLWYMGKTKQAPKLFSKLSSNGTPYVALIATCIIGSTFLLTSKFQNGLIFMWLVNISSLAGFIAWFGIALSHFRFRRAYIKQGLDLNKLPYKSKLFPFAPILAMIFIIIIIAGQQLNDIIAGTLSLSHFLATYIGLILFLIVALIYKVKKKTKLVPLDDCEFNTQENEVI